MVLRKRNDHIPDLVLEGFSSMKIFPVLKLFSWRINICNLIYVLNEKQLK
jgi:hypothetical protein